MLELYGYRFKIECTFRELKQVIGGFSYHFWSQSLPNLNYYRKKDTPHPLSEMTAEKDKEKIIKKVQAIERYILCSSIALGLLQVLSLDYGKSLMIQTIRYLRTYTNPYVSEATMRDYLRTTIYLIWGNSDDLDILQLIRSKQKHHDFTSSDELDKVA